MASLNGPLFITPYAPDDDNNNQNDADNQVVTIMPATSSTSGNETTNMAPALANDSGNGYIAYINRSYQKTKSFLWRYKWWILLLLIILLLTVTYHGRMMMRHNMIPVATQPVGLSGGFWNSTRALAPKIHNNELLISSLSNAAPINNILGY